MAIGILGGLAASSMYAQQAPVKRNFDAEIRAALQSAKSAAGFEFLGTLVRTCLLPQSGGEDTSDNLPDYVTNPARAPARETWYAEPARVFDNLYFVGGKVHSAWALTTSEGIILIDTIFPYNSEELIVGGLRKLGLDPKNIKYVLFPTRTATISEAPRCCRRGTAPASSWEGPIGMRWQNIRTGTRPWRRNATSSPPTA